MTTLAFGKSMEVSPTELRKIVLILFECWK